MNHFGTLSLWTTWTPLSEIGKCVETMVDGITLVNQCHVFAQEFGDSDYDYSLEFLKTKMIEH